MLLTGNSVSHFALIDLNKEFVMAWLSYTSLRVTSKIPAPSQFLFEVKETRISDLEKNQGVVKMERNQFETMCGDFQSHATRQAEKIEKLTREKTGLQDQLISKQKIIQEQRNSIDQLKEAQ